MRKRQIPAVLLAGCMLFGQTAWAADADNLSADAQTENAVQEETEETSQSIQEVQGETEGTLQSAQVVQKTDGKEVEIPWDQLYLTEKEVYAQLPELEIWYMGDEHVPEDFHVVVEDESVCSLEITSCAGNTVTCRLEGKTPGTTRAAVYYYLDGQDGMLYAGVYNITVKEKPADAADIRDAAMNQALRSNGIDENADGYISSSEIGKLTYFWADASDDPGLQIQDWSALGQMNSLESIDICGYDLDNLDFLDQLVDPGAVHSFSFRDGSIGDYSNLSCLSQLSSLTLSGNGLTDLSALAYVQNRQMLSWLYLSDNQITDVSSLEGLNLYGINLSGNPDLENVDPLRSMINLQDAYLDGTRVSADDRWELADVPDSITIGRKEEIRIPERSGPLGQNFTVEIIEGEEEIDLTKEDYYDRYIVTGNQVGSAKIRITWGDKDQEIPVTVTAPKAQEYYEQMFPEATVNRWVGIDLNGCQAVSGDNNICEASLDVENRNIVLSGKTPGTTEVQIIDSEGDTLIIYHVTVKEIQQMHVYLDAPVIVKTDLYGSSPDSEENLRVEVADDTVCAAEAVWAEQMNSYERILRIRLEGLKEGQTSVKIYQYGELRGSYQVSVKKLPENAVQIEDINIRSALLSGNNTTDANKDGYLTREELDSCQSLSVSGWGLTDLDFLKEVPNLTYLDVSGNKLADLKGIEKVKNLNMLYAHTNQLTSIAGVESLENLIMIYLNGNEELTDISPLYDLERLGTVSLPESVTDESRWELADFKDVYLAKGDLIRFPEIEGLFYGEVEVVTEEGTAAVLEDTDSYIKTFRAIAPGETTLTVRYHDLSQEIRVTVEGVPADQEIGEAYEDKVEVMENVILESNGQLWQIYPEVKKTDSNVKEYAAGWIYNSGNNSNEEYAYTLDRNNVLWNGEEKLAEDVVEFDGRYALTEDGTLLNVANAGDEKIENVKDWISDKFAGEAVSRILKTDGTLWTRSEKPSGEEPEELDLIAEQVVQITSYSGYLIENGTFWSYEGEKLADNVAELDGDRGYYDRDGVYYLKEYDGFMKTGVFRVKDIGWYYNGTESEIYALTEEGLLYRCAEGQDPELTAENVEQLGIYGQWLYQTADGVYRDSAGQSVENAVVEQIGIMRNPSGTDTYTLVSMGDGRYTACKNDVEVLTNAADIWYASNQIYCLRTDGTIWDITNIPKEVLDLQNLPEADYVRGDADGDGKADISDLRLVLRHVCRKTVLEDTAFEAADVTDDDKVDIQDLRKILRFVCRKITEL